MLGLDQDGTASARLDMGLITLTAGLNLPILSAGSADATFIRRAVGCTQAPMSRDRLPFWISCMSTGVTVQPLRDRLAVMSHAQVYAMIMQAKRTAV